MNPELSKREYFAALAMQGLLAADVEYLMNFEDLARFSVEQADAIIIELSK